MITIIIASTDPSNTHFRPGSAVYVEGTAYANPSKFIRPPEFTRAWPAAMVGLREHELGLVYTIQVCWYATSGFRRAGPGGSRLARRQPPPAWCAACPWSRFARAGRPRPREISPPTPYPLAPFNRACPDIHLGTSPYNRTRY